MDRNILSIESKAITEQNMHERVRDFLSSVTELESFAYYVDICYMIVSIYIHSCCVYKKNFELHCTLKIR